MLHQENKIMPRRAKCEVYNASSCAINHLPVHWIQHRSFFSKSVEKNTAEDTATKSNFPDNKKTTNENPKQVQDSSSLARFINKNVSELKKEFGDPVRVDKTAYGYDNYIYSQPGTSYMQVGVAKISCKPFMC